MHAADGRRMRIDAGNRPEIDVVDREVVIAIDEIDEALAGAVDGGDIELHCVGSHGDVPRAEIERPAKGGFGIAHAQRKRAQDGVLGRLHRSRHIDRLRIDDDVHRTLPPQLDFARTVSRNRAEPHCLEHASQGLRLRGREFDEFDAIDAERIERFGDRLAAENVSHRDPLSFRDQGNSNAPSSIAASCSG